MALETRALGPLEDLGTAASAEELAEGGDVGLDGCHAVAEVLRYLAVAPALAHEHEHLTLASRDPQRRHLGEIGARRPPQG